MRTGILSPFFSFLCHSSSLLFEVSIHVEIRIGLEARIIEEEGRRREEEEEGGTEKKEEEERKGTRRNETEDGRRKRKYYKRVFELSSIVL